MKMEEVEKGAEEGEGETENLFFSGLLDYFLTSK